VRLHVAVRSCCAILYVCVSVCLSNTWIVTKRNNPLSVYQTPYERTMFLVSWETNSVVLSLGVHLELERKREVTPAESANLANNLKLLGNRSGVRLSGFEMKLYIAYLKSKKCIGSVNHWPISSPNLIYWSLPIFISLTHLCFIAFLSLYMVSIQLHDCTAARVLYLLTSNSENVERCINLYDCALCVTTFVVHIVVLC